MRSPEEGPGSRLKTAMASHTQLLLDTLSVNLPAGSQELLAEPAWQDTALQYLTELLDADDVETLLDTATPLPGSVKGGGGGGVGIAEQIAELANESVLLDKKIFGRLNSSATSNLALVLHTNTVFHESFENFDSLVLLAQELVELDTMAGWKTQVAAVNSSLGLAAGGSGSARPGPHDDIVSATYSTELSSILQNLQSLTEILELPAITHSLIKLGQYSECIEISSLSKRLRIRYNDIDLVARIEENITYEINDMVRKLSSLLMTNLKQASMIKILSYLKRIIGNRDQLKSIFFHSRYKFITDEFDTLLPFKQSRLIEKYLKRTLEIFREFCFQTVITFDSVFDRDRHLTYVFLRSLTDRLCAILVENLPLLAEDSACDSLLLQLIYCCQSLSRVGGDFTASVLRQLQPAVDQRRLLTIVRKQKELVRSLNRV